jgi:predicted esterase
MPVFMAHGAFDTQGRYERTDETKRFLVAEGYGPDYGEYRMAHEVSDAEVRDVARWAHLKLPPRPAG